MWLLVVAAAAAVVVAVVVVAAVCACRWPKDAAGVTWMDAPALDRALRASKWMQGGFGERDVAARNGRLLSASDWRPFSAEERARVRRLCTEADGLLRRMGAARLLRVPWRLCKLDAAVENGWPFTVRSIIMLPQACIDGLTAKTLVHEKAHVLQRSDPAAALRAYQRAGLQVLGIADEFAAGAGGGARSNPDISRLRLGREGRFPEMRYTAARPRSLSEARVALVDAASGAVVGGEREAREALRVPAYVGQVEHADEIAACVAAELAVAAAASGGDPDDEPWRSAVVEWVTGGETRLKA